MTSDAMLIEKCSGCGQPIPQNERSCPNCGRKRKTPFVGPAAPRKPLIAQFCFAVAWVAVIIAVPMLLAGLGDSMRAHPASAGELTVGIAIAISGMFLFVASRIVTLLAEIANNTARSPDKPD